MELRELLSTSWGNKNSTTSKQLAKSIKKKHPNILFWGIRKWDTESLKLTESNLDALIEFNNDLVNDVFCLKIDLENNPPPSKDGPKGYIESASYSGYSKTILMYKDYLDYENLVHEAVHLQEDILKKSEPSKFIEFMVDWYCLVPLKVYLGPNWKHADRCYRTRHGFISRYGSKSVSEDMATIVERVAEGKNLPRLNIFEKKKDLLFEYGFLKSN